MTTENTMRTVNQGEEPVGSRIKQKYETTEHVVKTKHLRYLDTHNRTTSPELLLPLNEYSALAIVHAVNMTKVEMADVYGQVRMRLK